MCDLTRLRCIRRGVLLFVFDAGQPMFFRDKKKIENGKLTDAIPSLGGQSLGGQSLNGATPKPNGASAPAPVDWTGSYQSQDARSTSGATSAPTPMSEAPYVNGATKTMSATEALGDPAVQKQLAEVRTKVQAAVGQIVLAMSSLPRYRNQMLGDIQAMVLDPLMRDRIAIASEKNEKSADAMQALAGIAFWATVSLEVDARIREQIKTGSFPVRLKSADWTSGSIVWLLDVIAPSQKLATAVLINFRKVLKDQSDVRIHPVVARQIEPELLKKLLASSGAAAAQPPA